MTIKASGRSALILAAGLWVCFSGPSQAAADGDKTAGAPIALNKYTKHASHHAKKDADQKSGKVASKSADDSKPDAKPAASDVAADGGDKSPTQQSSSDIPPSVANANAQLASGENTTVGNAGAMSARASNILQAAPDNSGANPAGAPPAADGQVVAPDQLNDVDRALHEGDATDARPATTQIAMVSTDTPAATAAAASNDSSTLDRTSLIGKIFIGFGALLTMASAARMFMA
jgi:hypothetical protein